MINLTSRYNSLEDLWGELDSNLTIFLDDAFRTFAETLSELLTKNYISFLMETLPPGVMFLQLFNEKVRFGNLVLNRSPKLIVLPVNYMKTLREWDVLLTSKRLAKLKVFVGNQGDICKQIVGVPNPKYYNLGSTFMESYRVSCKEEGKIITLDDRRNLLQLLKEGKIEAGVMWEHEARIHEITGKATNRTVTIEAGLFKGADKMAMKAFSLITEEFPRLLQTDGIEVLET